MDKETLDAAVDLKDKIERNEILLKEFNRKLTVFSASIGRGT